ncbi:MAG TPA: hypothetical protein VLW75_08310, partial [Rhizomicrobium sp.]|nr:hypothetical protein [Rhizomicrobium sp.]
AWTTLVHRLTRSQDWSKVPALDDLGIQRLIRTYDIADERRSTTRYVAKVTYVFNADAVRRFLRGANIAYTDVEAHPILVVPMGQAYAPRSPWAAAWNDPKYASAALPLIAPSGDAAEGVTLSSLQFGTAAWSDIGPYAMGMHANQAVLAQALPARDHITVRLKMLAASGTLALPDVTVPVAAGTPPAKAFGAAADAVAEAVTNAWKSRSAVDYNARAKLTVDVEISSIADWGEMQQKLAAVPTVLDVDIAAMNTGEARVVLTYAGTLDQLHDFLAQGGLDLSHQGNVWRLAEADPDASASPQ